MTKSLAKAIALATVLGASASAHAVNVNPDGLGEVLLYSLYTTEQGNDTNISITNTTEFVKAVKVRFLEGQNSQEVLDFNLYLSPFDQWSGVVTQTANGAKLVTFDRSCTAPAIPTGGVDFRDGQYRGDGGEQSLARTRVGHVEIIEMGEIDPAFLLPDGVTTLASLATHDHSLSGAAGTNANCGALRAQFSGAGVWSANILNGFLSSTGSNLTSPGGLYGYATVLNVEESTQISYDALAIDNFRSDGAGTVALHTRTGSLLPSLVSGLDTDAKFKNGATLTYADSAEAISALLMKESISNDFVLDEGRLSETNWVVTFPTKRFHVNTNPATAPFVNHWTPRLNGSGVPIAGSARSCHEVDISNWDNEEFAGTPADLDFSPAPEGENAALCYETNILTFNGGEVLGGEFVSNNINLDQPDFQFGWMNMAFVADGSNAYVLNDNTGSNPINGLPVSGFSAVTIKNNIAGNGVMNNYGSSITHKAETTMDH